MRATILTPKPRAAAAAPARLERPPRRFEPPAPRAAPAVDPATIARRVARLGHRFERFRISTRPGPAGPAAEPAAGRLPLPAELRRRMERAFRSDFSRVRLAIGEAPRRLGARALTRGEEIAVAPNHYRPETVAGQRLLAHELAHVVQQRTGRARGRAAGGGSILDDPGLEAAADRGAVEALRGTPVGGGPPPPGAAPATAAAPAQPVWETVEIGSRERRYNLRDNKDGTWTHSKSGEVYHDTAKTTSTGQRLLTPVSPPPSSTPPVTAPSLGTAPSAPTSVPTTTPTAAPPQPQLGSSTSHDPKNVLFGIQESGKIEYLANTGPNRQQYAGKFLEAAPEDFATFKNAGKRTGSPKVQDPVSLARYAYDEPGQQFYDWDSSKTDRRGKAIDATPGQSNAPSANQQLLDRLAKGELVDRRRRDRTGEGLLPFDVGPYKKHLTLPKQSDPKLTRTYQKLSGIDAWSPHGPDVNRDHVPSGESLNQRGDADAYDQGLTIAIPNREFHQTFSPTFGSPNSPSVKPQDESGGTAVRRVDFDRDNPAAAAYRDTRFQLDSTEDNDYSTSTTGPASHPHLDLTSPANRLRQIGGYRKLNRLNTKIHRARGAKRGIDASSVAVDFKHTARKKPKKSQVGTFKYSKQTGKTQGELFKELFESHLIKTKRAKRI